MFMTRFFENRFLYSLFSIAIIEQSQSLIIQLGGDPDFDVSKQESLSVFLNCVIRFLQTPQLLQQ